MNPDGRPLQTLPLGARLRMLRLSRHRAVASIAKAIGVTTQTIYQWETGSRQPSFTLLEAYLREIGCSMTIGAPQ